MCSRNVLSWLVVVVALVLGSCGGAGGPCKTDSSNDPVCQGWDPHTGPSPWREWGTEFVPFEGWGHGGVPCTASQGCYMAWFHCNSSSSVGDFCISTASASANGEGVSCDDGSGEGSGGAWNIDDWCDD